MLAATVEEHHAGDWDKEHPGDWDKHLRTVCMAYNTSVHPSTGFSPFFMMFGRQAKILVYGSTPTEEVTYPEHTKSILEKAYSRVREHMDTTLDRQKELYDRRVHGEEFNVGDLVWLHNPAINKSRGRKLHLCPWSGPNRIIKKLSTAVYRIQDTRPNKRKRLVVHFNRLKPCSSTCM